PSFLGAISIEPLDFGSVAPNLEIVDPTEPFPEFYMPTEEEDDDDSLSMPISASEDNMQLLA
ncbi:hypothetical protein EV175_006704, partial [Coemansia sp. RSA 1933]